MVEADYAREVESLTGTREGEAASACEAEVASVHEVEGTQRSSTGTHERGWPALAMWSNRVVLYKPGNWHLKLFCYKHIAKVETVNTEVSFMSEQASLCFESIGLLGEYSPTSRKKFRLSSESLLGCMHHESIWHSCKSLVVATVINFSPVANSRLVFSNETALLSVAAYNSINSLIF
uniref:Uncharacterized protein n=1 Tax=Ananas comosus var. bracteatus TaxID=296719 RepID=A0A6V7PHQ5_ANACO|nr:unnamed protein product [Ananas comosus var. bracteatus]